MGSVRAITLPEISHAIAAQRKMRDNQRLSRGDKKALDRYRSFYLQAGDMVSVPEIASAVKNLLAADDLVEVSHNPLLSSHLKHLRDQGTASVSEVMKIQSFAGKLAIDEEDAINNALSYLRVTGGLSSEALSAADAYLTAGRAERDSHDSRRRVGKGLLIGATLVTAAGIAVALWFPPLAPAVGAALGVEGLGTAQTIAAVAGPLGGLFASWKIGRSQGAPFGVNA